MHVRLSGPTVTGTAPALLNLAMAGAVAEVADYTKFEVLSQLDKVLVNPTGYYESRVTSEPRGPLTYSVNDSDVVYGPWLEGVGSRNFPVTRFEGYHTFRIVRNRMAQKSRAVVEAFLARTIARL